MDKGLAFCSRNPEWTLLSMIRVASRSAYDSVGDALWETMLIYYVALVTAAGKGATWESKQKMPYRYEK